jgi:hypothetical protein
MYHRYITLVVLAFVATYTATSDVWRVGPTQQYKVPSAVASLVQDGDEVWIDPAEYIGDVAIWRAHRLKLYRTPSAAEGSFAILRADGKAAEAKAIWVIKGNDCIVSGIDFRECRVPDRNGAGIRVEGTNITVSRCAFRKNQDGILAGNNLNSTILVEYSEFEQSGAGDGLSHAIYINRVKAFIFRFNYSHTTEVGHECKSRAHFNYIAYNRLSNEDGRGSRNLDLPNGGTSVVIGNIFHKGANAENGNVIGYGLEGLSDTVDNSLYLSHNTVVSSRGLATFLRLDSATTLLRAVNNVLVGNMTVMIGESRWLDTLNNPVFASPDQVGFINPATYDYRITQTSPLRGKAVGAGVATSTLENYRELPLTPVLVYVHPCQDRIRIGNRDVGAYEYDALTSVADAREQPLNLYPNPAADIVSITDGVYDQTSSTQVIDITGRTVIDTRLSRFSVAHLPAGVYTVVRGAHVARLLVQR